MMPDSPASANAEPLLPSQTNHRQTRSRSCEEAGPAVPAEAPASRARFARITTFSLAADSGGFRAASEAVDAIISKEIVSLAQRKTGFVDCVRLIDVSAGEFRVVSFWEKETDLRSSGASDDGYYLGGQAALRQYVRYGMFKTELARVTAIASPSADGFRTSPYARVSTMQLLATDPQGQQDATGRLDDGLLQSTVKTAAAHPGFCGAHRLAGLDEAAQTYSIVTYWDSVGTLHGRAASFSGDTKTATEDTTGLEEGLLVSGVTTRQFQHLCYNSQSFGVPFFEPGSARAATFQLACISLGVGIFVVPSVLSSVGLGLGLGLIVMFGLFADVAMQLILHVADMTGASTYEGVFVHMFGEWGRRLALVSMAVACWTANCSHMQFIARLFVGLQGDGGGFLQTIVGSSERAQHLFAMVLFGGLALPFCFKRTLSELRHVSLVVVFFCLVASVVVSAKCIVRIADQGFSNTGSNDFAHLTNARQLLDVAPIAAFGFSLIAELFAVRAEATRPELLSGCAHKAAAIVTTIYVCVGLIGALAFESPQSNLLEEFKDDRVVNVLSFGLIIVITLLYPLINFPTVAAIDALVAGPSAVASSPADVMKRKRIESVAVLVLVIGLDTAVTDLSNVFGLAGSLGLGLIAYCLPVAAYLAFWAKSVSAADSNSANPDLNCKTSLVLSKHKTKTAPMMSLVHVVVAVVVMAVGLVMTVGSTASIIYNIAT